MDILGLVRRYRQAWGVPASGQHYGIIQQSGNVTIGIKTWAQIIQENKARLQFFQEKLEHQADQGTALQYLQEKYDAFLTGVIAEESTEEQEEETEEHEAPDQV